MQVRNTSPKTLFQRIRLEKAKELMSRSALTLEDVEATPSTAMFLAQHGIASLAVERSAGAGVADARLNAAPGDPDANDGAIRFCASSAVWLAEGADVAAPLP